MKRKYILFAATIITIWAVGLAGRMPEGRGETYCYGDFQAVYHYTDTSGSARHVSVKFQNNHKNKHGKHKRPYDRLIKEVSGRTGVQSELLRAVIKVESDFNVKARSSSGAVGLMQLMPKHFKKNKVRNPYEPQANVLIGARYLKQLIDRYDSDLNLVLAAYNVGPEIVDRYDDVPPIRETRVFVKRVLKQYYEYRRSLNKPGFSPLPHPEFIQDQPLFQPFIVDSEMQIAALNNPSFYPRIGQ